MKKNALTIALVLSVIFSLSSCKGGEKKADKPAEQPKTEEQAPVEQAKKEEPAAEETATVQLSDQAKKGFELMESFQAEKCSVCHEPQNKKIGPSWSEIAKTYNEKKGNIVKFLKGNAESIVDPAQFSVMKPNIEATKKLSGDQLASIAAYIRSFE